MKTSQGSGSELTIGKGVTMAKFFIALMVLLANASLLPAATVSLKGTVKNSTGSGVAGVTVTLAKATDISATTDAQGAFSLSGTTGTGVSRLLLSEKHHFQVTLAGNKLVISPAFENINGSVEIFSNNGRRTVTIPFSGDRAGTQTLNLPELVSGLNIIRVTIGKETITQTLVCLGNSNRYLRNNGIHPSASGSFTPAKQAAAAAVDTLVASKSGYTSQKVPIDSYEREGIAIIMQEEVTGEMPLVYDKEHTGADCPKPPLPAYSALSSIKYTPDPFEWSDKTKGRIKTRAEWRCRRAEIVEEIMKYETGQKPPKPEKFEATLSGNTINITCGVGSNTIKLSATISRPSGAPSGPIPAIINPGSLTDVFTKRGIAKINFSFESQLTGAAMSGGYNQGNFYKLYPQTDAGYMIRWAWGVSRVIDALQALPAANIDTKRIAVSGCSYMGKFALYSGTFDERIALTIPHESGGGGTISWRYSDMLETRDKTEVENLKHAQGAAWYSNALREFANTPDKLPFDQDELMALCAPRALFCIESSMIARMGAEAARLDAIAVRKIYAALGVEDRIGVTEANVNHCTWASSYTADLEAFVDKFLLGKTNVNTNILRSKFTSVDTTTWIPWTAPTLQ
ncbi:MAG: T9SS type A sorting domain-containing protein [Chitinispirillaceae bacterium]|nr:T9SS type A sorting domain-containing protein [Chitinispirillaceae bacterium]